MCFARFQKNWTFPRKYAKNYKAAFVDLSSSALSADMIYALLWPRLFNPYALQTPRVSKHSYILDVLLLNS